MYGMWDVRDVGCGMFGMWDVGDVGCSGCEMSRMWGVRDVGCSRCGMFGMRDVRYVGCSGCGMFWMWDVRDVGCGMWDVCRDVRCWFTKCRFPAWPNSSFDAHFHLCFFNFVHASLHDEKPYIILLLQICESSIAQEFYIYSDYLQKLCCKALHLR